MHRVTDGGIVDRQTFLDRQAPEEFVWRQLQDVLNVVLGTALDRVACQDWQFRNSGVSPFLYARRNYSGEKGNWQPSASRTKSKTVRRCLDLFT